MGMKRGVGGVVVGGREGPGVSWVLVGTRLVGGVAARRTRWAGGGESLSESRERLFDGGVVILVWGLGMWDWVLGGWIWWSGWLGRLIDK